MLKELAASFSEQLLDGTETQKPMHDEIEKRANYNRIFSPKQAGLGRPYSEMLAHEEKGMVKYRRCWENACGSSGSFENYSYLLI
jgi:hypothetical protein